MIRVENLSRFQYSGWLSATLADPTPAQVAIGHGTFGDTGWPFELGERIGAQGYDLRVYAGLSPGQVVERELVWANEPRERPRVWSAMRHGLPVVAGKRLEGIGWEGSWEYHRGRIGFFVVDLWINFSPDQQPFAEFELLTTASDPSVPSLFASIEPFFHLTMGDGVVTFIDDDHCGEILPAGETFADGQSRPKLGVIAWPGLFREGRPDADSARALATGKVNVIDLNWLAKIGPMRAVAEAPPDHNGFAQANAAFQAGKAALRSWAASGLGIAAKASQTGPQADQGFGGKGTALATGGDALTGKALLLIGLDAAKRPCHHRERDGDLLDLDGHPQLVMWMSRPHYSLRESRDQLGKHREHNGMFWPLQDTDAPMGWWGDDREHWFHNTLFAAYQLTGSPMAQCLIRTRAINFLFQETVDPRKVTSGSDAARSWGWASLLVNWLYLTLRGDVLMMRVCERFWGRLVIYQRAGGDGKLWDRRKLAHYQDNPANELVGVSKEVWSGPLPSPFWGFCMSYQSGFAAGMLYQWAEGAELPDAMDFAFKQAKLVMESSYKQMPDGTWQLWEALAVYADGATILPSEFVEGRGAHRSGQDFESTWMAPCIRAVLMREPENAQAQVIMAQIRSKLVAGGQPLEWLAPMVRS